MKFSKRFKVLAIGLTLVLTLGSVVGCDSKESAKPKESSQSQDKASYKEATGEETVKMMKKNKELLILDVRGADDYAKGHIINGINISVDDLEGKLSDLEGYKDKTILAYCNSGKKSAKAAEILVKNGFKDVYNAEGVKDFDYGLVKYNDITAPEMLKLISENKDAIVIDARKAKEFETGHLKEAINIPLEDTEKKMGELDKNKDIILYCRTGNRSGQAAKILSENGFTKVYNSIDGVDEYDFDLVK